jgi:hypothetical protein
MLLLSRFGVTKSIYEHENKNLKENTIVHEISHIECEKTLFMQHSFACRF